MTLKLTFYALNCSDLFYPADLPNWHKYTKKSIHQIIS